MGTSASSVPFCLDLNKKNVHVKSCDLGINLDSFFPCNQLTATSYIYQSLGDVEMVRKAEAVGMTTMRRGALSPPPGPTHPAPVGDARGQRHRGPLGSGMTG